LVAGNRKDCVLGTPAGRGLRNKDSGQHAHREGGVVWSAKQPSSCGLSSALGGAAATQPSPAQPSLPASQPSQASAGASPAEGARAGVWLLRPQGGRRAGPAEAAAARRTQGVAAVLLPKHLPRSHVVGGDGGGSHAATAGTQHGVVLPVRVGLERLLAVGVRDGGGAPPLPRGCIAAAALGVRAGADARAQPTHTHDRRAVQLRRGSATAPSGRPPPAARIGRRRRSG
jgi:hypothetical protein